MLDKKISRVDAIRSTSKVSAVRPLGFFDSLMEQAKPKKKRVNKPSQDKPSRDKSKTAICQSSKEGTIDCNV
jgi:hypothetical protein